MNKNQKIEQLEVAAEYDEEADEKGYDPRVEQILFPYADRVRISAIFPREG